MSEASPRIALGALIGLVACSSLPQSSSEVVALQVITPANLTLAQGDSLQLHAIALNIQGDTVPSVVRWRTADTANISLDSLSGLVIAKSDSGSARIQASVGTLLSAVTVLTLQPDSTSTAPGLRAP